MAASAPSVHPHIRGAYAGVQHIQRLHFRFIPTYVGHTIRRRVLPPSCAVHPHIRGAYRISALLDVAILGSSPPTWGIHSGLIFFGGMQRFIPTYVGHTLGSYSLSFLAIGSSPHTWGILYPSRLSSAAMRFIPTYVGHTIRHPAEGITHSVHPHIRGAYVSRREI